MKMNRRRFLKSLGVGAAAAGLSRAGLLPAAPTPTRRPNIVFVLADDLGYGDLQCLNPASRIPTPNYNKLAASGMVFTDAHSGSAVCTPTRYGVLTGRYSWRTRMKRGVLGGYSPPLIDPKRTTIASLLKSRGYATGCVGKWHLGLEYARGADGKAIDYARPLAVSPATYGFDFSYIIPASLDMPPYVYVEDGRVTEPPTAKQPGRAFPDFIRAGERSPGFDPVRTLDVLTAKAVEFIAARAGKDAPFFLYFPMTAPHKPVSPAKRFRGNTKLGPYGDFITQVDWAVGQVVAALDKADARQNTLLIVSSDNGSFMYRLAADAAADHVADPSIQGYKPSSHTSAHVFRGTKADIYEGGHHVPYIASWPGRIRPGSTCDRTICLTDLMATFAAMTGEKLPTDAGEDSFSTLPLLLGRDWEAPRAPVVHHSANGTFAIREGQWKLVFSSGSGGREKPVGKPEGEPGRLFDLSADLSETTDVASGHGDVVARLTAAMERIRSSGRSR